MEIATQHGAIEGKTQMSETAFYSDIEVEYLDVERRKNEGNTKGKQVFLWQFEM